jgi:hypothetical protein
MMCRFARIYNSATGLIRLYVAIADEIQASLLYRLFLAGTETGKLIDTPVVDYIPC